MRAAKDDMAVELDVGDIHTKGEEWGVTIRYADGTEETNRAGDLYYWPGGHTGWTDTGVVFAEFSPATAIAPVLAHLGAKLAASGAAVHA